jgi:hypothetical protein
VDSPVVDIGDWVGGTTGNMNSSGVEDALNYWVGKRITIPVFDQVEGTGSNAQYHICKFAVFELTGWDKTSKTMTGIFVRALIPGESTDADTPDLGATDLRMVQ